MYDSCNFIVNLTTKVTNMFFVFLCLQVPANCNRATWAGQRLLKVVTDTIALQLNYCKWRESSHCITCHVTTAVQD